MSGRSILTMAVEIVNGVVTGDPEDFLDKAVAFQDGSIFERTRPITDFRKDPGEARILYICRRTSTGSTGGANKDHEFVMKIKAQWPGPQSLVHAGPSPLTAAELKVLELFRDQKLDGVPHLVDWKLATQSDQGIHPEGYITFTVMTKVPGQTLWDLGYWSMSDSERDEIRTAFLAKLREIRALGIAPYDCALRNVLWDKKSKSIGIVDFEHYKESKAGIEDETVELQRWGLVSRPVPGTWFVEWGLKAKEAAEIGITGS